MPFKAIANKKECATEATRDKGCFSTVQECYHACKDESFLFIYAREAIEKCISRGYSCKCQRGDGIGECDEKTSPYYDLYAKISKL